MIAMHSVFSLDLKNFRMKKSIIFRTAKISASLFRSYIAIYYFFRL